MTAVRRARLRKLWLALHLIASVGWLGALFAYVAHDVTVAASASPGTIRAAWNAMWLIASLVIAPLAVSSLVTGVVLALTTKWGLLRHWWVVVSLALTSAAVVVLVLELPVIARSAAQAATATDAEVLNIAPTLPHSLGGLAVLIVVHVLNVFKPAGVTPYGWRQQSGRCRP